MLWLNVSHLQQTETGSCLPACVAMVAGLMTPRLIQRVISL
jgi:hypothetical protein